MIATQRTPGAGPGVDVDRQLVAALRLDGRAGHRSLAAQTGESESVVASRLRQLEARGAVRAVGQLDWEAAGYRWFVSARAVAPGRSPAASAAALATHPDCVFAATAWTGAGHRAVAQFLAGDRDQLHRLIAHELPALAGARIDQVDLATFVHRFEVFDATIGPAPGSPRALALPSPVVTLDRVDHSLLAELTADARCSNRELARRLGVTEGTIRGRLKRLLDAGLLALTVVVDARSLGLPAERALCQLEVDPAALDDLVAELGSWPGSVQLATLAARADLQVMLVAADRTGLEADVARLGALPGVERCEAAWIDAVVFQSPIWASLAR